MEDLLDRWPMGRTFDLPPLSTCVVAGAFTGRVMELLDALYDPERIIGFEPQIWAFQQAWQRLSDKTNCLLLPWGISTGAEGIFEMVAYETDECSFVGLGDERGPVRSKQRGEGRLVEATRAFRMVGLGLVDLAVINMEGYEYPLLPYLIDQRMTADRMVVQFHTKFGTDEQEAQIRLGLDRTHEVIEDDFPRWVYWRRRGAVVKESTTDDELAPASESTLPKERARTKRERTNTTE
jgi:hypothetical protein